MWPREGSELSPPSFPSLITESQGTEQVQSRPSNSRSQQTLILGPLQLTQTAAVYRRTCKAEEPVADKELGYHERAKRIKTDIDTSDRFEDRVMSSVNFCSGFSERVPIMPPPTPLARDIASKVIRHARCIKYPKEYHMYCPDCKLFPVLPVTGSCGHTRCTKCIEQNGACPCGTQAPDTLHLNILIQDVMTKMLHSDSPKLRASWRPEDSSYPGQIHKPSTSTGGSQEPLQGSEGIRRQSRLLNYSKATRAAAPHRHPVSPQAQYEYARELLSMGRHQEAAPQLAHVAASTDVGSKTARLMLAQVITVLSAARDPRRITRELYRSVRELSVTAWLRPSDLECVICYQVLRRPLTTPCGHTFCRTCIERTLRYRKYCALCARSLHNFSVAQTADTSFLCAALTAIDAFIPPAPLESEFMPIFACTVAYPSIPCPLLIFDPRHWAMIRRVLDSGSRKFGMVAYERDRSYSDYGTILEVRDCVQYEDGHLILSTVGVSRFRVIERKFTDGCYMARIEELIDIVPVTSTVRWEVQLLAQQISYKALLWLASVDRGLVSDIEATFGRIRYCRDEGIWWENPNGPEWLWWLIAILPLKTEIQVLMLSTKHLMKRMMAVSRTLDVMDQVNALAPGCELVLSPFGDC